MDESGEFEIIFTYSNGGVVRRHILVNILSGDYNDVINIAKLKAAVGLQADILPDLSTPFHPLYDYLFAGAKYGKFPDLRINNEYFIEVETPKLPLNAAKVSRRIKEGAKQADYVVIVLKNKINTGKLYNIAKGRFCTHKALRTIEFLVNERFVRFDRQLILKRK